MKSLSTFRCRINAVSKCEAMEFECINGRVLIVQNPSMKYSFVAFISVTIEEQNPVGAPFFVESETWPPKETNVHNIILLQHNLEMTSLTTFKVVPVTRLHQTTARKYSAEIRVE
uniref:Phlebovirus glycoprotein G2 fusion domain-containing protein n=1 Tax=Parascaris univalens TaxID=6257 RepID=A0A915CCU8_PARUN